MEELGCWNKAEMYENCIDRHRPDIALSRALPLGTKKAAPRGRRFNVLKQKGLLRCLERFDCERNSLNRDRYAGNCICLAICF